MAILIGLINCELKLKITNVKTNKINNFKYYSSIIAQ